MNKSFKISVYPTPKSHPFANVLLPGEAMDHSTGNYRFGLLLDRNLVSLPQSGIALQYVYWQSGTTRSGDNCTLNLDVDGHLYILNATGNNIHNVTNAEPPTKEAKIYMVRLDVDGIVKAYSHTLDSNAQTRRIPPDEMAALGEIAEQLDRRFADHNVPSRVRVRDRRSFFVKRCILKVKRDCMGHDCSWILGQTSVGGFRVIRSVSQWSAGTSQSEDSIHTAYCSLIENAEHFVYIENQFFISGLSGDEIIQNRILEALYRRILRAHKEQKCFRVVVVIPLLPGSHSCTLLHTPLFICSLRAHKEQNKEQKCFTHILASELHEISESSVAVLAAFSRGFEKSIVVLFLSQVCQGSLVAALLLRTSTPAVVIFFSSSLIPQPDSVSPYSN
ncbi:Phospholipase D zeta 2 [Camellia lanceoleosa]|uniref:Phospholipase D zeta 2 n=1 Tax=Camellia lanceoleosa TaxID=1840588 RepID=A0ACC0GJJ2_9ERIC|nr:Phospholipase D zeta 2 [Camellia lanceoleosa]